jgi:hypothetical protein
MPGFGSRQAVTNALQIQNFKQPGVSSHLAPLAAGLSGE